ncbi:MAG: fibronectin type III domain-containing protein [Nitrospirae bacterium]|nr:fibronectin type III domain-containing protein [Nitrospirota bacterium]
MTGPIAEGLFGDIPVSALPPGPYDFYIAITPAGGWDGYYLWQTQVNILSLTVKKFGTGYATSDAGVIDCGASCEASYAPGAVVNLSAVPGEGQNLLKWAGCDVPSGASCTLVMNKDRSVTPMFGTEPELKPNVKMINENIVQCLSVTADTYSFELSKCPDQEFELSKLSPGDVLVVNAGDNAIRRVMAVNRPTPGNIVAETELGDILDLADNGTIVYSGSIIPPGATVTTTSLRTTMGAEPCTKTCSEVMDGNGDGDTDDEEDGPIVRCGFLAGIACPNGETFGLMYHPTCTFTCQGNWNGVGGTARLYLDVTSNLTADLDFGMSFGRKISFLWTQIDDPLSLNDLHLDVKLRQVNNARVDLDAEIKYTYEKELFTRTFGSIQIWYFTFIPTLSVYAGFEADLKASVKTSVHTDLNVDFGFKCTPPDINDYDTWDTMGNCRATGTPASFITSFQTPQLCASADLKAYVKPAFTLRSQGLLGVYMYPYPYLRLHADGDTHTNTINWDLYAGANLNLGVDVGIPFFDIKWKWDAPPINLIEKCIAGSCNNGMPISRGQTATIEKPAGNPLYTNLRQMPVSFTGSGENSCSAQVASCAWDFGDGSPQQPVSVFNGECAETTHSYAADGDYIAKLTITYGSGATATDDVIIKVKSSQPLTPDNVRITHPQVMAGAVPPDDRNLVKWDKPKTCETIRGHAICSSEVSRFYNYRVYRRAFDSAGALLPDPTVVTVTQNTYADAYGLNEAKLCYQVTSLDGYGNESDPTAEKCEVLTSLPVQTLVPSSLPPSSTGLHLNWPAIDGNNLTYTILRDGTQVQTVTDHSFHDTGLLPNKTYCYTIIVTKNGLMKRTGKQTCFTTASDVTPPTTPTGVMATPVSTTEINLSWDAATDNIGVAGYRIYRSYGGGFRHYKSVTGTSLLIPGLLPGQRYCFLVSAFDAAGNESQKSAEACATTPGGTDTQTPTTPSGVTATAASSSRINLAWTASTDNVAVTGYEIYKNGSSTPLKSVTGTSTYDTGLSPSTRYCYQVSAFDAAGNKSGKSVQACATTQAPPDTQAPSVPMLSIDPGATSVTLAWAASTDNVGVTGYEVYRDNILLKTVTTTYTSDLGLSPSTNYCYQVLAFDAAGNKSGLSKKNCFMTSP